MPRDIAYLLPKLADLPPRNTAYVFAMRYNVVPGFNPTHVAAMHQQLVSEGIPTGILPIPCREN